MRKQMMRYSVATVVLMALISAWAWFQLPGDASIPVHWNAAGEVDRYGSKMEGLLLTPILTLLVAILFYYLPKLDPRGENLLRSNQAFRAMWIVLLLFLLAIHFTTTFIAMGFHLDIGQVLMPSLSILFIVMGNYMGKIRQNYTMGIRTPWTLYSEEVWNKTHRLGGWLFVIAGLLTLIVSFLNFGLALIVFFVSTTVAALGSVVYSYLLYRKEMAV